MLKHLLKRTSRASDFVTCKKKAICLWESIKHNASSCLFTSTPRSVKKTSSQKRDWLRKTKALRRTSWITTQALQWATRTLTIALQLRSASKTMKSWPSHAKGLVKAEMKAEPTTALEFSTTTWESSKKQLGSTKNSFRFVELSAMFTEKHWPTTALESTTWSLVNWTHLITMKPSLTTWSTKKLQMLLESFWHTSTWVLSTTKLETTRSHRSTISLLWDTLFRCLLSLVNQLRLEILARLEETTSMPKWTKTKCRCLSRDTWSWATS